MNFVFKMMNWKGRFQTASEMLASGGRMENPHKQPAGSHVCTHAPRHNLFSLFSQNLFSGEVLSGRSHRQAALFQIQQQADDVTMRSR